MIQNVFTSAKALSLAALVVLGFTIGRNGDGAGSELRRQLEPTSGKTRAGIRCIRCRWVSAGRW